MSSKVCFTDFHCRPGESHLSKLERLVRKAGIENIDFQDKFVAVKVHFGEWGNMAFLRQQYARVICDLIKSKGGRPFLTDCNTLYPGFRDNAVHHLDCAYMNGYNPLATGVQTIIADGLRGNDEREIPVEGGKYVQNAKIGAAVAEADVIISLNHFKGHVKAGFGGALKNLGMGCGSKKGKMEMHSTGTPMIHSDLCIGCGMCVKNCANDGVHIVDGKAVIDEEHCLGCGHCFGFCPKGAIDCKWDEAGVALACKIAEYTKAVVDGKQAFHISLVVDVSPFCDCDPGNDVPMIPDVGMFASFDPVALDQACADACAHQPIYENSFIGKHAHDHHDGEDIFKLAHPDSEWEAGLDHAAMLGLGTRDYELITL
ncbi:MAG: DUF362 domain-containing protein [Lachnospiraceae bacterium]|nr:DUF362 domain-containing protein [Lachnospiraceae bacterium]